MSTPSIRRLLYGLAALYLAACAITWPFLPERMPLHFGFTGHVTSWTRSSPVLWFLLPALGLGLTALTLAASAPPEAWNLSREDVKRFRALSADLQGQIRDTAERSLLIALMLLLLTLMSLQVGIFATAVHSLDRMPAYATAGTTLSLSGAILVGVHAQRRLRSQVRSAAAQQHEPAAGA